VDGKWKDNRPASWFHSEVQIFACDEEFDVDEELAVLGWERLLLRDEIHERTGRSGVRP
jgi:hypothetical protein